MSEEVKAKIIDFLKTNKKKRLFVNDISKGLPDESRADVKTAIKEMCEAGTLNYWSSGSTVYICLPENMD